MKKQLQQLSMICTFLILSGINLYSFPFQETAAQDNGRKMNFQGTLYENGEPVNGDRSMTFSIELNEETWTETQTVQIIEGLYSVVLGSVTPLPSDLFFGVEERELTVSVGNNTLGTVPLYAPFALNDNKSFGKGGFKLDSKEPEDSVALNAEIFGTGTDLYNMAVRGLARTESTNTGVAGIATGSPDNTNFQTGVIGNAFSNNKDAWATGTWGTGFSYAGAVTYGMRGEVYGTGATFSAAARGLNFVETGQDGVKYGGYFDTRAGTNSPYSGRSIGVQGTARGSLENIGVFGSANGPDGTTNWAGWFEGNVALRNGGDLTIYNPSNQLRLDLNYFETNDAGSLVTYGHNNTRRSILGSSSDRSGGLLNLIDSLNRTVVQLRATSRTESWVTDTRPHGQFKLDGPTSQNISFGSKVWEAGGADRPTFQMFGTKVDDPNNPGNLVDSEMIFMSVQDNGDGEQGLLQFGKAGAGDVILNRDNTKKLLDLVQGGKFRFEVNPQNSGVLKLLSSVDNVNVLIDSNGPKAGLIHINDSLGRANLVMRASPGGGSYLEQSAGLPDIGETRVTYQLVGDANPWTNMIARKADGTAKGRVQSGWLPNGGENIGQFRISDGANRSLAQMFANETRGAELLLSGPNTSNFWLGNKNWENSDLPFMAMRGAQTLQDGNGNNYNPDGLTFEVSGYDDGSENGRINFSRIENGVSKSIGLDYTTLNNLVNPEEIRVLGPSGNEIAAMRRRGGGDFGMAEFKNINGELKAEIGSFGDNSGFMQLYGPNNNKNIQMGGSDGARDFGMLKLFDDNGRDMFRFQSENSNTKQVPAFRMFNPQALDGNNNPKSAISAGVGSDPNGDGKYSTYFNLEGPDAPLIHMGAQSWESNDGSNRARISMFGNDQVADGNGGTYTPERVSLSIAKDAANTEYGNFILSNSSGGGFEAGARRWENNNQGGNLTYTALKGTFDINDGNGGTYRPWLVSQQVHNNGNGTEYGSLNITSTAGSSISLDGSNGNINISGVVNQSSDARLKKNVITLTSGLAYINQLRGVRYNWKDESKTENKIGFIAQEVEEVLPELVKTREDGFKGINYAEMTAVLVEAVKELTQQIEDLKKENTSLKAELSTVKDMEDRLAKIEALIGSSAKGTQSTDKK